MSLVDYLDDMARAIKEKSGYEGKMTYSEMPDKIRELAYEDPMAKYKDYELLVKNNNSWEPFAGNSVVLELMDDEGKPYKTNKNYTINSNQDVFGIINSGNVDSLGNPIFDELYESVISTSGSAYIIAAGSSGTLYSKIELAGSPNAIGAIWDWSEGEPEDAWKTLAEHTVNVISRSMESGQIVISEFDSAAGTPSDIIYCVSTSGATYGDFNFPTLSTQYEYWYLYWPSSGREDIPSDEFCKPLPEGFGFLSTSGDSYTETGYNHLSRTAELEDIIGSSLTDVTMSLYHDGSQWVLDLAQDPAEGYTYTHVYQCRESSGKKYFSEINTGLGYYHQYWGSEQYGYETQSDMELPESWEPGRYVLSWNSSYERPYFWEITNGVYHIGHNSSGLEEMYWLVDKGLYLYNKQYYDFSNINLPQNIGDSVNFNLGDGEHYYTITRVPVPEE